MRYWKQLILICTVVVLFCTGCGPLPFSYSEDYSGFELHQVAIYNVPGGEVPHSRVKELESDSYGRILFTYYTEDAEFPVASYLICQRRTDQYVYYYEKYCVVSAKDFASISDEQLETLKSQNDWGTPFNEAKCIRKDRLYQKMSAREYNTVEGFEIGDSLKYGDAICKALQECYPEIDHNTLLFRCYAGTDTNGKSLFYVDWSTKAPNGLVSDYFAIIINQDGTYEEQPFIEIKDFYNCNDEIAMLKERMGWDISLPLDLE